MESVEITAKEKIYNTAKQLYLENGFENTPITLIAKEADVTLGLVTYYYKTKDIIASDMLNLNFETLTAHLLNYLPENDGLLQYLTFNQLHFKLTELDSDYDHFIYEMNKFDLIEKATRAGNLEKIISKLVNDCNPGEDTEKIKDCAIASSYGTLRNLTIKQYENQIQLSKDELCLLFTKHFFYTMNIDTKTIFFDSLLNSSMNIVDRLLDEQPHLKKVSNYLYHKLNVTLN